MGKIYLIRHGQTDSNTVRRFQGRINTELNDTGKQQAVKLAEFFRDKPLHAIYCSPLVRAKMTAEPLAAMKQLPVHTMETLQEISFGGWEGLCYDEIAVKWPEEIKLFYENPQLCLPPEGETFSKVQERAVKALQDILLAEGEDKDIAVISHGGVIRTQICALLDIPLANFWRINVHNASTTCFTVWDGNFTADIINDHHYL